MNIPDYLQAQINQQKLGVLVFGPDPAAAGRPDEIGRLASKRIEIRDALRVEGHTAEFPEDLLTGLNAPPPGQVIWFEQYLMNSHDLVIVLGGSHGASAEIGYMAGNTNLAKKGQLFLNRAYQGGLVNDLGHTIETLGGKFSYFDDPVDLTGCHLKTRILQVVKDLQTQKYFAR